jgi:murE/murF fusion protein
VEPGYVFVAIPGTKLDGRRFIKDALAKGAVALVLPRMESSQYTADIPKGIHVLGVDDPRLSAGILASAFYDNPAGKLALIGITGTNGKTTVSYLLEGILREAGLNPGVIGTVSRRHGDRSIPSDLTTPDSLMLHATMAGMLEDGARAVVLEVSSHALDQKRVSGCSFAVSVFTNLSRDHLDYHRDMEEYFGAKARLFQEYPSGRAVINVDDIYGRRLWSSVPGEKISYGMAQDAMVRPDSCSMDMDGIRCTVRTPREQIHLKSRLIGRHNLSNILTAVAASTALEIDMRHIKAGIQATDRIPGRLEAVPAKGRVTALVDYAHTPDAIENVLRSIGQLGPGRLICVVGCGGDRDRGKRPLMARAAASLCDLAVFTSDNPRTEDPMDILAQMTEGLKDLSPDHPAGHAQVKVIPDRRDAIFWATRQLREGDCLLVAGKGHEKYQIFKTGRVAFDDTKVLSEALGCRDGANPGGTDVVAPCIHASQVARATGAKILSGDPGTLLRGITTDSRSVKEGELFWALPGERFDGNTFAVDALSKGAAGAAIHGDGARVLKELEGLGGRPLPVLLCMPDTLKGLGDLAAWYRGHLGIKVVAITGSCGKTTTKELVAAVLGQQWSVARSLGNFNNLIGMPLSLLRSRPTDPWAVLEMGVNRPGEMERLCAIAGPQVGLITTIQPAHLEGLGDINGVAREKGRLFRSLPPEGIAVVNLDDPLVVDTARSLLCRRVGYSLHPASPPANAAVADQNVTCLRWAPAGNGTRVEVDIAGRSTSIEFPLIGKANIQNAIAAAAVGHALGLSPKQIKDGLESSWAVKGRLFVVETRAGCRLIDDTYNANPASMKASLETLRLWTGSGKKAAVLGDMFELGDASAEFHRQVGRFASSSGVNILITAGRFAEDVACGARETGLSPDAVYTFPETADVMTWMETKGRDCLADCAAVLIKGSRAMGLERVVAALASLLGGEEKR